MMPLVKISTSMSALSVSTSAMMSPRQMLSPTFLRQPSSLPALISAPSCGMTNSAMARNHFPGRANDFLDFG